MIENKIEENTDMLRKLIEETRANTAAQNENTIALLQVLAASGATTPTNVTPIAPAKEEASAPAPKKELKITKVGKSASKVEVVEAAPEPEPEAEEPEAPAAEEPTDDAPFDRDEVLLEISTSVKAWMKGAGNKMMDFRNIYEENRKVFGVATASELPDDKLPEFAAMVRKMIADNPV